MAHVKAGGTSKNMHDSPGQRLGVKRFGGQKVSKGEVLVRQRGSQKVAGKGTLYGRDWTIHAAIDGIVHFRQKRLARFSGRNQRRTIVEVK